MKKYLLSLAVMLIMGISAKAQFTLVIKGGVNVSKINTDNFNRSSVTGYQAGAFARIGKSLYVQPELYLSSKGGQFNFDPNGANTGGNAKVKFTT